MADMTVTLKIEASRLDDFVARVVPVMARLTRHAEAVGEGHPNYRLVAMMEDVLEGLIDAGLLVSVETLDGKSGILELTPSPVLQRCADLMSAICDGLEAIADRGAA